MLNLYKKLIIFAIGFILAGITSFVSFQYTEILSKWTILLIHMIILIIIINYCNDMVVELMLPGSPEDHKWQIKIPGTHSLK